MDLTNILTLVLGLLLRIGIPVLATVLVFIWLNRLDKRWQQEAEKDQARLQVLGRLPGNTHCWEVNHCSEEKKKKCPAFKRQDAPCFQVFRTANGFLKEQCLGCKVFKEAPIPIAIQ